MLDTLGLGGKQIVSSEDETEGAHSRATSQGLHTLRTGMGTAQMIP
jgi:hypothetical protein